MRNASIKYRPGKPAAGDDGSVGIAGIIGGENQRWRIVYSKRAKLEKYRSEVIDKMLLARHQKYWLVNIFAAKGPVGRGTKRPGGMTPS